MKPISFLQNPPPPQTNLPPLSVLVQVLQTAHQHAHGPEAAAIIADWCRQFVLFHGRRHPKELGLPEVGRFLQHVAAIDKDPLKAIAAARGGLDFLYREVLRMPLNELPWPKPPKQEAIVCIRASVATALVFGVSNEFISLTIILSRSSKRGCHTRILDGRSVKNRNTFINNMLRQLACVQVASKILDALGTAISDHRQISTVNRQV